MNRHTLRQLIVSQLFVLANKKAQGNNEIVFNMPDNEYFRLGMAVAALGLVTASNSETPR